MWLPSYTVDFHHPAMKWVHSWQSKETAQLRYKTRWKKCCTPLVLKWMLQQSFNVLEVFLCVRPTIVYLEHDAALFVSFENAWIVQCPNFDLLSHRFALPVTKPGGICLVKLWDGNKTSAVETDLQRFYKKVRRVKPKASRSDSTEVYLLASDFLGIKT